MARYPTYSRFKPTFHLGHVDKVYDTSNAEDLDGRYGSTTPESQKIKFYDVMESAAVKSTKVAVPLLRGVSDSITRGDLVLYTVIGNRNFYLGPVNTNNLPSSPPVITAPSTDSGVAENPYIESQRRSRLLR